jgi:signal transduction histidine kinase
LGLSFKDQRFFTSAAEHQTAVYFWTAVLVVASVSVLTFIAVRFLHRQTVLARLKNGLAATVSHELKTPLAGMRVLVDTLLDSDKLDEKKVREYLQLIAQENERLSRVIHNFLAFSRIEREDHAFKITPVEPGRIIEATVKAVRERFEGPGCQLEVQVEADLPLVNADPDAMVTALINLVDNAWKYSKDTKHVTLGARAEKGQVLFWVRDTGIGIAAHETRKIFRPFYQVDRRLSSAGGGCGLGLSIVDFIARAHHGRASVESEPNRGSTFMIGVGAKSRVLDERREVIKYHAPPLGINH